MENGKRTLENIENDKIEIKKNGRMKKLYRSKKLLTLKYYLYNGLAF